MTGNKITIFKVSFFVDFILCSVFKSSLNHNYPETPVFSPDSGSSLMTGACHHLSPAPVFIDDRFSAQ